ncbi:E3 ubiquitin-protein ligase UHRF1-like [Hyposmocoma kahamanoa]|uniref:E3 ubiquitin-protein ligase UHRF1-like n=1 Tax=Hyposmocoma kahamanoa TaxID=1477025 RepID=UPI000E6D9779|nr:E3 ubiquitin-protein ligase UHRF1-like [Hyposmocoma kahamanoa]
MHVRIRVSGKSDTIVVVESKLTKIENFRRIIKDKFDIDVKLQRLFYGGKLLEDGYTFHDYNIKLNDVIQLMIRDAPQGKAEKEDNDTSASGKVEQDNQTFDKNIIHTDVTSQYYIVGDIIDMRDREYGAWFEGKIVRIVLEPKAQHKYTDIDHQKSEIIDLKDESQGSDSENTPPGEIVNEENPKSKRKGIAKYFTKAVNKKKEIQVSSRVHEDDLLFKIQLDDDEEDSDIYCKLKEIRPRARNVVEMTDLKEGQTVMINYNTDHPLEKGYWYDFTLSEIKKTRTTYELVGTLYLGPEAVPQNETQVKVHDKIFNIEEVIPLEKRSEEYKRMMATLPEKRSSPLNCLTCRDNEMTPCKDCGCFLCLGKENPEKIVLCDECNNGYHMKCLIPPLKELPEEDWYCPSCKRDPTDVVAPGAAKQTKKTTASKSSRDWGRGMACVGKTKTCAMPPNHFGPIPGIEVGMCWRFRIQLSESGVHRPPVSGIHGRDVEGAYSIVLSGGYEDDVDNGDEFTYTGSGGRDLSGNKRTAEQSCDQTLARENKALARNCAVKQISETGGDAGDNWREGKPVRVVRSYKMLKHFPKYAPKAGIRYDGIYKVVKYYPEKGLSGYRVWKYLLRRDDPSPAPWEAGAKEYSLVYPDGYLEAEAEKQALKEKNSKAAKGGKKRALRESNVSESNGNASPPGKKRKTAKKGTPDPKNSGEFSNSTNVSPKTKIPSMFAGRKSTKQSPVKVDNALTDAETLAIKDDALNKKLWEECLEVCRSNGKKGLVDHVTQVFLCIICQDVPVGPVTTPCLHNFCMACLKLAFKSTGVRTCPCCRQSLVKYEPEHNEKLRAALQCIMPGYDAGRK